ncbi:hypothetical protein Trydic_g1001 [Trypoxylus dichotomus]
MAMSSPLSLVLSNIYTEEFERRAMDSYELKPKMWLRYVDDTFVIWPHGEEEINGFLQHLNGLEESIKFTMEVEVDNRIPFLDILVHKQSDGSDDLVKIDGIMKKEEHRCILKDNTVPSGLHLIDGGFQFKQDNDLKDTSKLRKDYLKSQEHHKKLKCYDLATSVPGY